jgi:hypothetical protein
MKARRTGSNPAETGRCPLGGKKTAMQRDRGHGPAEEQEDIMRTLGYVAAIAMATAGAGLGLLAVKSVPDVRRYMAIRKM